MQHFGGSGFAGGGGIDKCPNPPPTFWWRIRTIVPTHRQAFLKFLSISHLLRHLVAIQIGQSTWFQVTNNSAFYPQLRISNEKSSVDSDDGPTDGP